MMILHRPPAPPRESEPRPDTRVMRAAHVAAAPCGDDVVLLDPIRGEYYTLNRVGGRIWELLAAPTTIGAIVGALQSEFEVPAAVGEDRLTEDVSRLLLSLRASGLLAQRAGATIDRE